jgi:Glycosyl transferases group 1
VKVFLWHVHGSWTTSFVHGRHEYVVPVTPDRGPDGLGRARTYPWPDTVRELPPAALRDEPFDVVILQRPQDEALAADWLGRRPGRDVPAVYVEHNTPKGDVPHTRHPFADRGDVLIAHVTGFNQLFWDNGRAPTAVVEHGIVDPGERYTGDLARAAVVINEPVRRGRVTGSDLLGAFAAAAPLDVYGMGLAGLRDSYGLDPARVQLHGDVRQADLHGELARRRVYVHPLRWTSLGLSLLEAMQLAMPVVVVGATEAFEAVPPGAGVVSTRLTELVDTVRRLLRDPDEARVIGKRARAAALERYGLHRFLQDWDQLLTEVTR